MPPKKKVEPEVLQQQFEQWQETAECKKWQEMSEGLKKFPPVTETTLDINGPWQDYFDELMKFFGVMKAKTGKIKEIKHEMIRSFFFAREDKESDKIIIDGILCGVVKEHADRSWTLRHKFCDIFKAFKSDGFYEKQLANIQLIDSSSEEQSVDVYYQIRSFKSKALCEKYCVAYSEVLRVLDEESKDYKLISRHDLKRVFYKLTYVGWQDNACEKLYLQPLSNNFAAMQKELMQMYALGVNYWKVPLAQNEDFLREMENLIRSEVIADRLIGTPLKRELFNFIHAVIALIKKASPHLETNMLKKDENSTLGSIPKLVVFKMIQHMFAWRQRKEDHEAELADRVERLKVVSSMKASKTSTSLLNRTSNNDSNNNITQQNLTNANVNVTSNASFFNNNNTTAKKDLVIETNLNNTTMNGPIRNDASILNASSIVNSSMLSTRSTSSMKSLHTSTSQKVLKAISIKLPVVIPSKSAAATNKQEIFNFADDLEAKSVLSQINNNNQAKENNNSTNTNEIVEEFDSDANLKLFGRYFYLEGLIHPEKMQVFETCVTLLKNINPAVQQDIEDNIMLNGITPKTMGRHDASRVNARLQLESLQEHDFANVSVNAIRPPELWNFPTAVGTHAFRSIAKPKESYLDGRVEVFDEKLEQLAQSIISFKPETWKEIISRSIDVFADTYNKNITPVNPAENFG